MQSEIPHYIESVHNRHPSPPEALYQTAQFEVCVFVPYFFVCGFYGVRDDDNDEDERLGALRIMLHLNLLLFFPRAHFKCVEFCLFLICYRIFLHCIKSSK